MWLKTMQAERISVMTEELTLFETEVDEFMADGTSRYVWFSGLVALGTLWRLTATSHR